MSRRLARESAIKFLYSTDFNKEENLEEMLLEFFEGNEENNEENNEDNPQDSLKSNDIRFAQDIIRGTIEKLTQIDQLLQSNITGWTKERIAKVDLAILRLALYEIMFRDDIPESVSINEALELAKKYSTDESSGFVNGVLGKIIRESAVKGV